MTPDYASYSISELMEARATINAGRHPENMAALEAEIERRSESGEIDAERTRVTAEVERVDRQRMAFARKARVPIAWYLILTAPVLAYYTYAALPAGRWAPSATFVLACVYALISAASGVLLLRRNRYAHYLAIAVFALQLLRIQSTTVFFSLLSAVGGFITIGSGGTIGIAGHLDPGLKLVLYAGPGWQIGINGLAAFVIGLLWRSRRPKQGVARGQS